MSTENNGYLDSDQTIVNFAVRELGVSFEQLLNDDPSRMLRNWLKCRRTARGTAIGTTILGAIGVMGAVLTGAIPLLIAGVAVAAVSGMAPQTELPATQIQPAAPGQPHDAIQPQVDDKSSAFIDDRFLWTKDLLNFPAVLIWGSMGSGKTSFASWLLRQRIKAGHKAKVFDPHAEYGQWNGLKVVGAGMNYSACDIAMQDFIARVRDEYKARSKQPNYSPTRETTLVDEFTKWAANCPHSGEFFITALSDIRKIQKAVIFISHDRSLAGLGGAKGFSQARDNGLAELHLSAIVDPATGEPRPAMKGKLKIPGKAAIEVEIAPWMNGAMNFSDVVQADVTLPTITPDQQVRARLEGLYQGEMKGETEGEMISPQGETGETVKRTGETGETPYSERVSDSGETGEMISHEGETEGETGEIMPDRARRICEMKRAGLPQTQIIAIEFGAKPGKGQAYLEAVEEYKRIIDSHWQN